MPICRECNSNFSRPSSLRRHERSCHGNEQHQCPGCLKFYARHDNLAKHLPRCKTYIEPSGKAGTSDVSSLVHTSTVQSDVSDVQIPLANMFDAQHGSNDQVASYGKEDGQIWESQIAPELQDTFEPLQYMSLIPDSSWRALDSNGRAMCGEFEDVIPADISNLRGSITDIPSYEESTLRPNTNDHATQSQPQSNVFLDQTVRSLRSKYPNARIEGVTQYCPTTLLDHMATNIQCSSGALPQFYVSMIRCLHCPGEKSFFVTPFQGVQAVEEHLSYAEHEQIKQWTNQQTFTATPDDPAWPSISQLDNSSLTLSGQKLLILAVKKYDAKVLGRLLYDAFDVNERDGKQRTALHWACELRRHDMAELLIKYGARLEEPDVDGETPLDTALRCNGVEAAAHVVQILARVKDLQQLSRLPPNAPLALACSFNKSVIVEAMIHAGADVNQPGINSPLEIAVRDSGWAIVQLLLAAGAQPSSISGGARVLLMNKRDGVSSSRGNDYADAGNKIRLLKGYGLDLDEEYRFVMST